MSTNQEETIEVKKLDIERERLALEQQRAERENRFINKHFGAIATALVSIAAVLVSVSQIQVAELHKSREIELSQLEADRQWRIRAAEFVAANWPTILSEDQDERQAMVHLIKMAFPKDISDGLLNEAQIATSPTLLHRFWKPDGLNVNSENAEILQKWMSQNGINTSTTIFLRANEFEEKRIKAIEELALSSRQVTITGIPGSRVEEIVAEFQLDGASNVAREKQPDGNWTVTATFPTRS